MFDKIFSKFQNASPAVKASMALLFANLVLKGLSLISGPIFTRIMPTDQYGIVSTFQSWQGLLSVIVTLNLAGGVFNNGMLEFKKDRDAFELSLLAVSSLSAIIFYAIFLMFSKPILDLFGLPKILVNIMFLYFLIVPAYGYWSGRQRYEYKYKALTIITIVSAVISLILGVVLVYFTPDNEKAISRVIVIEGTSIVMGVFFYVFLIIKGRFKIKLSYCKYAIRFNLPLIPHYMSMYVLGSSDRIMIAKMVDTSATAVYSVAYTVSSVISIVWQSIDASLSPWIYEKLESRQEEKVRKRTFQIMIVFAVMCIGCTLFAPEIMTILAPATYSSGIYAIPSVASGVFFTGMYSVYMRVELYYKHPEYATIASGAAAIINIILNYICIGKFGFLAAGYTTMFCYALLTLFHYIILKYKGYEGAFDNRRFLILSMIVIGISICMTTLYSHFILRYSVIFAMFIVIFIKKKQIIHILRKK